MIETFAFVLEATTVGTGPTEWEEAEGREEGVEETVEGVDDCEDVDGSGLGGE